MMISRRVERPTANPNLPTLIGIAIVFLVTQQSGAQSAADAEWMMPRTSFGHPDLQGHWTSSTVVPLERPEELGTKAFFTAAEAAAYREERLVINETEPGTAADVHYQLDDFGLDRSQNALVASLRTSLIVDPPNGRLPPMTQEARDRADARAAFRREHGYDSAQNRPLAERCIWWRSEGPPMLPVGYNSNYQIMQTEDHVVVLLEMIHDARIIPLTGHELLPDDVRQWLGDSRGHWEGDTLVVETSNLTNETSFLGSSEHMKVVERFTRTGPDSIRYEFTVSDPHTWEAPWSAEVPLTRQAGPMFEYACHEGNYGIANILSGIRAEERAKAASGD